MIVIFQIAFLIFYGLQAVERLNIKPSFFKDLLTDEPFTRKDIISIQVCALWSRKQFFMLHRKKKIFDTNDKAFIWN